jgi:hypothetical protein
LYIAFIALSIVKKQRFRTTELEAMLGTEHTTISHLTPTCYLLQETHQKTPRRP